ncbi:MAG TPA: hypothetical protein VFB06_26015 [Streptosporangiaceae bacterium]|nr:hypothetical protein [Streptosporangiaceae bacterium]
MFKIGNITRENNPCIPTRRAPRPGIDTWTMIAAYSRAPASGVRIRTFLTITAAVLTDCLTAIPRHMTDRMFLVNDAEAYWRGWQIIKIHGGLGRRYRDPAFDTLAACSQCAGAGQGIEDMPCITCFGTGRLYNESNERLEGGVS